MSTAPGAAGHAPRHPAEQDLDTVEEQARALMRDLRESFAPSYLTLISIIEGVLLGLAFQLLAAGQIPLRPENPAALLLVNNLLVSILVWNEYRMGSSMFRWVPALGDAVIPFVLGAVQAALMLTIAQPVAWLGWLAVFYAGAIVAFRNMYSRSAEEARNAFVLAHNRRFQRLNLASCLLLSGFCGGLFTYGLRTQTVPTWRLLAVVTLANVAFLLRGEANWRAVVASARAAAFPAALPEIRPTHGADCRPHPRSSHPVHARDAHPAWHRDGPAPGALEDGSAPGML